MALKELLSLDDKVALVTGGSRGLGLQIALGLGEMGARVVLVARREQDLETAVAQLAAEGVESMALAADLSSADAVPALVGRVLERAGTVDILVNNAGATWGACAEAYPDSAWRKVMGLNVDAVFALTREVGRRSFIPRRHGKVLNIASVAGLAGNRPQMAMQTIAYNTSKGALLSFTRALAAEWGRYDINVNALCPGFFPTRMTRETERQSGEFIRASTPLGRLGGDEDLMGAAAFLVCAAARHITGQALVIDGGMSAT